jgi:hypothetical protein
MGENGGMEQNLVTPSDLPPNSPKSTQFHVPQFGIIHLLAWTAMTAVLLKTCQAASWCNLSNDEVVLPIASLPVGGKIIVAAFAIIFAAGIVGYAVLLRARCWLFFGRLQPGHCLVLVSITVGVFYLLLATIPAVSFHLTQTPIATWAWAWLIMVAQAVIAGIWLWAGTEMNFFASLTWRSVFRVLSIYRFTFALIVIFLSIAVCEHSGGAAGMLLMLTIMAVVFIVSFAIMSLLLFGAIISDLRNRNLRDWLHWVGILLLFVGQVAEVPLVAWMLNLNTMNLVGD